MKYDIGFVDLLILKFNGKHKTVVSRLQAMEDRTNKILERLEYIHHIKGDNHETTAHL